MLRRSSRDTVDGDRPSRAAITRMLSSRHRPSAILTAVLASLVSAPMGRPVETERWADAVDRWQYGHPAR